MKKKIRILAFLLAILLCVCVFASCKSNTPVETKESATEAETEEFVYQYGKTKFEEGTTFTFCNLDYLWDMYIHLDADPLGDKIDRQVYERNQKIEKEMKCELAFDLTKQDYSTDFSTYLNRIQNALMSEDNKWDVVYLPVNKRPEMITSGMFQDISDISNIKLGADWWDPTLNEQFTISDRLYFASSALQLMSYDSAWGIFYNTELIKNYGIENPIDLVNSNNWTIEKLSTICKTYSNVNTSPSFYWSDGDGDQLYGMSSHPNLPDKLLYATGERFVTKNSDGKPEFSANTTRFTDVVGTLANFLSYEGNLAAGSNELAKVTKNEANGDTGGYVYAFNSSRAIFMGGEIKIARYIKSLDTNVSYGIVPLPKYNSEQKEYYTPIVESLMVLAIPATVDREEDVGAILDALSYYSYVDVLPAFYDNILYRGYNEEDVPMMDIINKNRGVDMAYYYGWNNYLASQVRDRIFDGSGAISDALASEKTAIESAIKTWSDNLKKLGC